MNKRALTLGLLIAVIASVISQALLHGLNSITVNAAMYIPYYLSPLLTTLIKSTSMLAWAIPGVCIGYLCKSNPVQHGAILGIIYGAILGAALFAFKASDLISIGDQAVVVIASLTEIIKYSVLFALTAPAGYLFAKHRANL
ncbi:hypothetical protein [Pseudomonas sp. OTU750018]|uniref:hypothetical protein n=1 Tax=Pseudomonas sp. OTU750018 TaxID=2709708 RepID=UPI001423AE71|nr:hypothetical protein [Pseudomonas sp. OTU750018]